MLCFRHCFASKSIVRAFWTCECTRTLKFHYCCVFLIDVTYFETWCHLCHASHFPYYDDNEAGKLVEVVKASDCHSIYPAIFEIFCAKIGKFFFYFACFRGNLLFQTPILFGYVSMAMKFLWYCWLFSNREKSAI